ncbi:acyltransferase family protein [Vibrio hannami]|uniref:acyltransferase n=1 Tax=Vibrio hannami TaxID=2717094 RepID=UPI00240EF9BF|nr:acyltransferase family protein [Vibrio hannami]MDG3084883.1 acyltransferase family protein [Vibrio hannami]
MNSNKIASLELGRVIAMFAIILLHCHILHELPLINDVPWIGYVVNQLARFGVPFFFILSGYLVQPKLTASPLSTFSSYSKPLLKIWFIWSVICLLIPFNLGVVATEGYLAERFGYWDWLLETPINTLMEGGLIHLWFIPGLICAVGIIAVALKYKATKALPYIAIGLYLYGVAGGSYVSLTEIWTPFFTRNGPFFNTLMVWVGFEIRRQEYSIKPVTAAILACAGMLIHFGEATWLYNHGVPFNTHDFLLGTSLWGTGLFMLLLANPTFGNKPIILTLANMVLGVYVAHLPIMILFLNLAGVLELTGYSKDVLVTFGATMVSLLLIWGISRSALQKVLLR